MAVSSFRNVRVFLINLDRSPDRLAIFERQAKSVGLGFVRFPAIDGLGQVPEWLRDQFPSTSGLKPGEIGCYASHLCICKTMVEQELDTAIILEDDINFVPDFERIAAAAIERAPHGWDIIHLSSDFKRAAYPVAQLSEPSYDVVRYARMPAGSAAYAISRAGAMKLLKPGPRTIPFDLEFRYAWQRGLEIYGVHPEPAWQRLDLTSTITGTRPNARNALAAMRKHYTKPSLASQFRGRLYIHSRLGWKGQLYVIRHSLFGRGPL